MTGTAWGLESPFGDILETGVPARGGSMTLHDGGPTAVELNSTRLLLIVEGKETVQKNRS